MLVAVILLKSLLVAVTVLLGVAAIAAIFLSGCITHEEEAESLRDHQIGWPL